MKLFKKKQTSYDGKELPDEILEGKKDESSSKAVHPNRVPLTHKMWAKVAVFILAIIMIVLAVGSAVLAGVMIQQDIYTTSYRSAKNQAFQNIAEGDVIRLVQMVNPEREIDGQYAIDYLGERNISSVKMTFTEGPENSWNYDGEKTNGNYQYQITVCHIKSPESNESWYAAEHDFIGEGFEELGRTEATIVLSNAFREKDDYYLADLIITFLYTMKSWVYVILVLSVILAIVCFVFLMCASGRRKDFSEPQPGWGTKIPFDLLAVAAIFGSFLIIQLGYEWQFDYGTSVMLGLFYGLFLIVVAVMLLGFCMSFALRVKLGGWWKNTVVFYTLCVCTYLLKKLGLLLRKAGRSIITLFAAIPLIWKTVLLLLGIGFYNFFAVVIGWGYVDEITIILLVLEAVILIPGVMYVALVLRRLYQSSQALAAGDLCYQIDTKYMIWDFKQAAVNLNSIGKGMTLAVEERTKSERMKTELITNVSHDIKTPLTSIINYSDLIEKESCDNPKITEYAEVLHRQSERLKRLIDDLVEASKASTGNLEVILAPCELNVLLTQTAGEYMQRMSDAGLELVTQMPEEEICVMGDGRRMWRVFDNLTNNACKYAVPGTRVYITLQKKNGMAVIAFKNTSRLPLNITADELMERFVRGDESRNTEGNGLGLSIAKSLTELQNGSMEINIDGDFFKVELKFPIV